MQSTHPGRRTGAPVAVGILLIVAGIAAVVLRQFGLDLLDGIERAGWPLFIIIPGLVLLAMAILPAPPQGLGFAIAGSIVTTVGLLLFYQQSTGHWQSWAYAWALIPAASGFALTIYGLATRHGELVTNGLWVGGVSVVMFATGFWFFETIFESGQAPLDLATWWPVILIGVGLLVTVSAVVTSSRSSRDRRT
jgi:hypothetical protein